MVIRLSEQTASMTLADLVRLYESEGPFELINGERVVLSPIKVRHNVIAKRLFVELFKFDPAVGEVFMEAPFILVDEMDWVKGSRIPDVMFFSAARLAEYRTSVPDWQDKPFILVPDLVIEVVSTHDSYSDLDAKVERYLGDGVRLVWVVDPQRQTVKVIRPNQYQTLHEADTLTGEDIVPGLLLPVQVIFGNLAVGG